MIWIRKKSFRIHNISLQKCTYINILLPSICLFTVPFDFKFPSTILVSCNRELVFIKAF
jgi:hypothetical protein